MSGRSPFNTDLQNVQSEANDCRHYGESNPSRCFHGSNNLIAVALDFHLRGHQGSHGQFDLGVQVRTSILRVDLDH